MRALALAAALACAPSLAFADDTAAVALHDQGIADMKSGNLDAACKELATSLELAPDSGTKGALATCYTKQKKLASAWTLWKNLADTAPNADLKKDAFAAAMELEPRLPHFVVKVASPTPAGLAIKVNGLAVDPSLPVSLPIDPGPVAVTASAPGRVDWTSSFTAEEAKTLAIEVPALAELPKPSAGMVGTVTGGITSSTPASVPVDPGARHSRHVLGVVTGVAGIAVVAAGSVLGLAASSKWNDAKTVCGGDIGHCANVSGSQSDVNTARGLANLSTAGFAIGGAAVITGAILYLTAPSNVERQALRVVPSVGPTGAGLVLTGGF